MRRRLALLLFESTASVALVFLAGCGPGQIIVGSRGVLYGLTSGYGTFDDSVFSLTPPASPGGAWKQTVLHTFAGGPSDGGDPTGVVMGGGGVLYGTTNGGISNYGTVFSFTP